MLDVSILLFALDLNRITRVDRLSTGGMARDLSIAQPGALAAPDMCAASSLVAATASPRNRVHAEACPFTVATVNAAASLNQGQADVQVDTTPGRQVTSNSEEPFATEPAPSRSHACQQQRRGSTVPEAEDAAFHPVQSHADVKVDTTPGKQGASNNGDPFATEPAPSRSHVCQPQRRGSTVPEADDAAHHPAQGHDDVKVDTSQASTRCNRRLLIRGGGMDPGSTTAFATIAGSARARGSSKEWLQLPAAAVGDGASGSAQCGATERQGGSTSTQAMQLRLRGGMHPGPPLPRTAMPLFFPLELIDSRTGQRYGTISSEDHLLQVIEEDGRHVLEEGLHNRPPRMARFPSGTTMTALEAGELAYKLSMGPPHRVAHWVRVARESTVQNAQRAQAAAQAAAQAVAEAEATKVAEKAAKEEAARRQAAERAAAAAVERTAAAAAAEREAAEAARQRVALAAGRARLETAKEAQADAAVAAVERALVQELLLNATHAGKSGARSKEAKRRRRATAKARQAAVAAAAAGTAASAPAAPAPAAATATAAAAARVDGTASTNQLLLKQLDQKTTQLKLARKQLKRAFNTSAQRANQLKQRGHKQLARKVQARLQHRIDSAARREAARVRKRKEPPGALHTSDRKHRRLLGKGAGGQGGGGKGSGGRGSASKGGGGKGSGKGRSWSGDGRQPWTYPTRP